jgi:PelA/Pel-15E family pectate lyase
MKIAGLFSFLCAVLVLGTSCLAADPNAKPTAPAKPSSWRQVSRTKSPEWYKTDEARRVADNLLIYQGTDGGWGKNIDMAKPLTPEQVDRIEANRDRGTTLDNGATYTQIKFLANMYAATGEKKYYDAYMKGVNFILSAQYPNGGWPQFYPLKGGYSNHITFNDSAMLGAMRILDDIAHGNKPFDSIKDDALKAKCKTAVERGIDCILKCQIVVDGRKTVWCQQHDEVTFKPATARKYELVSLSGSESAGIVRFLMDIDKPSPQVKEAVEAAVIWFDQVKIVGIRQTYVPDANWKTGSNKVHIKDPAAPPSWARFYEIGTNKAMFVDRDGIPKYSIDQIGYERRNGYAWLGSWGQMVLDGYPEWAAKWTPGRNVLAKK